MVYRNYNKRVRPPRLPIARKRKRWYVNANARLAPKVPYLGGSAIGFSAGNNKLKRIIRREIGRQEETKQVVFRVSGGNTLTHNQIWAICPSKVINAGTGVDQRLGNQIYLKHITLKGAMQNLAGQPVVRFRFICFGSSNQYAVSSSWNATNAPPALDLFHPGSNAYIWALLNNKLTDVKVITDRQVFIKADTTGAITTRLFKEDCRVMRKCTFVPGNTTPFENWNYYFVVIPFVEGGTTGSTITGNVDLNCIVTFSDM